MSLAESIATALGDATPTANGWRCKCPYCNRHNALTVTDEPDFPDDIIVECAHGCHFKNIKTVLKMQGLLTPEHLSASYENDWVNDLSGTLTKNEHSEPVILDSGTPCPDDTSTQPHDIETFSGDKWALEPIIESTPVIPELFDIGDKVVIIGQSKTRKSFFALQLALSLAASRSFLGFPVTKDNKILIVQFEIRKNKYHARFNKLRESLGVDGYELNNLHIVNARGKKAFEAIIEDRIKALRPSVVILDPFYKLMAGDENKSEDVKPILAFFDTLSEQYGCAVIYVHHDKKGVSGDQQLTDRGSGSGVLARDFDSAIFLSPHKNDTNGLVVEFIARNYPPIEPITINWIGYSFVRSEALPLKQTKRSLSKGPRVSFSGYVALAKEVLALEYAQGFKDYTPSVFNEKLKDAGIDRARFSAVKEQLVSDNIIEIETTKASKGQSSKRIKVLYTVQKANDVVLLDDSLF